MKKQHLLFRIVLIFSCVAFAYGKGDPKATAAYEKALKQIKSGDLKVDFKALRLNCSAGKYSCAADAASRTKVNALLDAKKYAEALKEADKALEKAYVDIEMHFFAGIAATELQNKGKADFHRNMVKGLLDSIKENKRGRSRDDAYVVITLHEEHMFLQYSGMRVKRQRLLVEESHTYDECECAAMDSEDDVTLYFNLDIPLKGLSDWYNGGKTK
jgi:hypothetical protein